MSGTCQRHALQRTEISWWATRLIMTAILIRARSVVQVHPGPPFLLTIIASFGFVKPELGRRRFLSCRWRWWRNHEFGVVHRNVLLKLLHLNGESVAGARKRPAEWRLQAIRIAIIRIVDLRWVKAERSLGVPHESQQQARFLVQV